LHITKDLLDDAYRNAQVYETLMSQYSYEECSEVMKVEPFEKFIAFAQKGLENSDIEYTLLQIIAPEQEILEVASKARRYLRDTDEIGRLANGMVAVILLAASSQEATLVVERLRKAGIESLILPKL
jgi:hypothetical protein